MSVDMTERSCPQERRSMVSVFFGEGFRPLFLLAGLWGALSVPLFLGALSGMIPWSAPLHPVTWHVHEMMFGYVGAVLGGFVLTAIPNWTGRPPLSGTPLVLLALAWLAGRVAVWWGMEIGALATALADLAFLCILAALVGKELVAGRSWRNLPILAGVIAMLVANILFHLPATATTDPGDVAIRLSITVMALLLALVGGRIVPNFTRNWFAKREGPRIVAPMQRFDLMTLAATAIVLVIWVVAEPSLVSGILLLLAGALNVIRLVRWRGWNTGAEPLIAILHIGYLWFALGLCLLGLSMLSERVSQALALHVLSIGAFGAMTLAVMTRATLGHTGRELHAGPWTVAIYILATLSVFARAAFEVVPGVRLLWVAGGSWAFAFVLFTGVYAPMLLRPRKT